VPKDERAEKTAGHAKGYQPCVRTAGKFAGEFWRAGLNPANAWGCLPRGQFSRANYVAKRGAVASRNGLLIHIPSAGNGRESQTRDVSGAGSGRAA
jgi:hypothetical protein